MSATARRQKRKNEHDRGNKMEVQDSRRLISDQTDFQDEKETDFKPLQVGVKVNDEDLDNAAAGLKTQIVDNSEVTASPGLDTDDVENDDEDE